MQYPLILQTMPSQQLTPEQVRAAQELVVKVQGISSCQISTDGFGEITEIHVVATVDKPPKLIARDVETCLKAEMGINVDYKKIGVVIFDSENGQSELAVESDHHHNSEPQDFPPGVQEFAVEEFPSRLALESISIRRESGKVRAEVELKHESGTGFGSVEVRAGNLTKVVAEATLVAVLDSLDESIQLCLGEVLKLRLSDKDALVVQVDVVAKRETRSLAGCVLVSGDPIDAVVYATLDAVNRVLGRLELKSSVEYRIT